MFAFAGGAGAQALADPTKPAIAVKSDIGASDAEGRGASGPRLQMVMIGPKRAKALLNGEWVEQGSVFGVYRVHQIKPDSVILKSSAGKEEVRLTPAIELRPVEGGSALPRSEKSRKASVLVEASKGESAASTTRPSGGAQ